LDTAYAPEAVAERCGIPAETIRRVARELAAAAFDSKLSLPIAWTDAYGRQHDSMAGRPVAMHAMRGISAHSNGFHTCRALHALIRNAWARDPAPVDVLFMFMANMSWNSAMNTSETMHWLTDRDPYGGYRIPRIIYVDAYSSEMVAYADLVLPDTTYLERHDAIS